MSLRSCANPWEVKLYVQNVQLRQLIVDLTSGPSHLQRLMNNINTVYTLGEDPMECPRCMSRTEFDQLPNKQEVHTCLGCGFKFIAEEDPDEDSD